MGKDKINIGLVGIGEIARNQHVPSIRRSNDFSLISAASRNGSVSGVANFTNIEDMLKSKPELNAVSICTPPAFRFDMAWSALQAGKHVMLEKPPGATLSEVETLRSLAQKKGLTLFATWHSRFAPAIETARIWLKDKTVTSVEVMWKEDVKHWHPGQSWIWQAGGMGVFDPVIGPM